uniref:Uncharacterized protein n=1 Tax=Rhizophora mucronata TaxID=61149 RepID=A0A2P2PE48_RHIMU
MMQAMWKISQ